MTGYSYSGNQWTILVRCVPENKCRHLLFWWRVSLLVYEREIEWFLKVLMDALDVLQIRVCWYSLLCLKYATE